MSGRRAREVRVRKARDRERWWGMTVLEQYDGAAKAYFSKVTEVRRSMQNEHLFRFLYHVPWVEVPPGGVKPCRMNGKPARY